MQQGYPHYGRRIDPRELMAMTLMQQGASTEPIQHWTQGLARMAQAGVGGYLANKMREEEAAKQQAASSAMMQALGAMQPRQAQGPMEGTGVAGYQIPGDMGRAAQILAGNPDLQGQAWQLQMQADAQRRADQQRAEDRAWKQEDRGADEAFRREMMTEQQKQAERMARLQAGLSEANRTPIAVADATSATGYSYQSPSKALGMAAPAPRAAGQGSARLPASVLKLQNEELDAIGTAAGINADLGGIVDMIDAGGIDLGPVENQLSRAKNFMGVSDTKSRNFATFNSTLEKMRNDSLRLNKGVQTEGDAVRAWNEILSNINDPALVKQRLLEVQKINERAAALRRMNIDVMRQNYGAEPLDTSAYQNVGPAVGGGGQPAQRPAGGGIKFLGFE